MLVTVPETSFSVKVTGFVKSTVVPEAGATVAPAESTINSCKTDKSVPGARSAIIVLADSFIVAVTSPFEADDKSISWINFIIVLFA